MKPSGQNLSGIVFDLDDTLTIAEFKDEMWARTIEHIRVVLPDVDGDELRRRASAARDVHYAEVPAGTMGLDTFRRTQLARRSGPVRAASGDDRRHVHQRARGEPGA